MVAEAVLSSHYVPRPQFEAFHQRNNRWSCLVCHRRAGKTVACVNELITRALYTSKKNARYAYIAPFYRQAKDVAWQYLKEATAEFSTAVRESELRIILPNGAWITLYGADNIDALRGLYLDGVVIDEYGDCRPGLWGEVILPTLADRKGWAVFIGTPKGNNHFKHTWDRARKENWFTMMLKATDSNILDPDELAEMRKQMSQEEWDQEMECSFQAALKGAYYADLLNELENTGHVSDDIKAIDGPVNVATDLGFTDSTSMWFWQMQADGLAIIDYEEAHSKKLDYYFDLLDSKGYEYDTIWLPHDAKQKSLQTGKGTIEQFLERGYPARIAPKLSIQDGINAVRKVLPYCYFHDDRTYFGREGLKAYRRDFDEIKRIHTDKPRHDWASHPADGFRVLALVTELPNLNEDFHVQTAPKVDIRGLDSFTLDELFKMNESPTLRMAVRRRI